MAICQDRPFHLYGYIRLIKIVVRIFGLLLIGVIIYLNWGYNQKPQNYQDCAGLKDSVISLTYPQTCTARDGQRFIQKIYEKLTISPSAPTITSQPDNCCSQIQLQQGYECLQGCGGPHVRKNDPTPAYSCLNPTQAYSRKTFGCPICLASNTYISTPQGSVKVIDLKVGMPVWSVDKEGNKISVPILRLTKTRTPQNHRVTRLILSDGRRLDVSPNHPDMINQLFWKTLFSLIGIVSPTISFLILKPAFILPMEFPWQVPLIFLPFRSGSGTLYAITD